MTGKRLEGRTLFVTGGNTGIGLATALLFAEQGADIAIYARRAETNAQAGRAVEAVGVRCLTFTGDVTDETQLAAALAQTAERLGGLHYAFNHAGADQRAALTADLTITDYTIQMDVNVMGTFLGMKHQIPLMLASGGGAIVNNASAAGPNRPRWNTPNRASG